MLLALPWAAASGALARPDKVYLEELKERARASSLSQDPQWRRLLHYSRTPTGRRSDAAAGEFFLSPAGRRNPQAELDATLEAFFEGAPSPDRRARCRFPARYAWLKSRLTFDPARIEEGPCPAFEEWRRLLAADSVSLVFADAYLNNPSSMYGHTFLLLNRSGLSGEERLLDHAVNFAADAATGNGALFAIYGLSGFFPGRFSVMPYYLKVQEYNNLESRDLWEYRLHLSSAAVGRLLDHLWELGQASFPYYFLNKNCSYQLLPLLDVAEPALGFSDRWPLYVIPIDTVRRARAAHGLVADRSYRPSHVTRMLFHRAGLSKREREAVESLARTGSLPEVEPAAAPESRALALHAASEYLEYRIDYRKDGAPGLPARQHELHRAMAALGVVPAFREPPPPAGSGGGAFKRPPGLRPRIPARGRLRGVLPPAGAS